MIKNTFQLEKRMQQSQNKLCMKQNLLQQEIKAIKQNKNYLPSIRLILNKQIIIDYPNHQQIEMLSTYTVDIARNYSLPQVEFSELNLSSCSITLLNEIPTKLLFISSLFLDNNLLQSLSGIQQFMNLQTISINFNFIQNTQQLKKINNKFLVKSLSYIGNPVQNLITIKQLKKKGFSNLMMLNDIKSIGKLENSRSFVIKQNYTNKNNYSFNQSSSHKHQKSYLNRSDHLQNSNLPSTMKRYETEQNPMKRYETEQNRNQSMRNSQFIYLTKRQQSAINSKRQKDFQSTGDTRKRKLSSFRAVQNSRYQNSPQPSPNFNQYHYNNNEKSLTFSDYRYRQSLPNRKVTEFNLYPVDQEMTRSRNLQNVLYQQAKNYRTSSNEDQQIPAISFKKIKQLHRTINYQKHVNPFQETLEINYPISQEQRYRPYRSQKYQLRNHKIEQNQWQNQSEEQKEQGINNNGAFQLIQKQIPIYKQAIAIAFYYRNLLEKVFRGFQTVTSRQRRVKSQNSQNSHSNRKVSRQHQHDQGDTEKFISYLQNPTQNLIGQKQTQYLRLGQNQIQLLKFAWMKIQLYSNYKKVIQKYLLSNKKSK